MSQRWVWHIPVFVLARLGVVVAATESQAKPPADLLHPRNLEESMARGTALMDLGQKLFFETALSGSGKMSCATCHDPANDFTPANDLAVQMGGEKLDQPGNRAVPTLKYLQATFPFEQHHLAGEE